MHSYTITNFKFSTIIGVRPEEQENPQTMSLDLMYSTGDSVGDDKPLVLNDSLEDTIDYDQVAACILNVVNSNRVKLIETLGNLIIEKLMAEFPLLWINLTLHKPGALLNAKDVAVTFFRRRS